MPLVEGEKDRGLSNDGRGLGPSKWLLSDIVASEHVGRCATRYVSTSISNSEDTKVLNVMGYYSLPTKDTNKAKLAIIMFCDAFNFIIILVRIIITKHSSLCNLTFSSKTQENGDKLYLF